MVCTSRLEDRILQVEGFRVCIKHLTGRDVDSRKEGFPQYPYKRGAKNKHNITKWKETRFKSHYVGYEVDVLKANGRACHGRTLLSTLRDTYLEDM